MQHADIRSNDHYTYTGIGSKLYRLRDSSDTLQEAGKRELTSGGTVFIIRKTSASLMGADLVGKCLVLKDGLFTWVHNYELAPRAR